MLKGGIEALKLDIILSACPRGPQSSYRRGLFSRVISTTVYIVWPKQCLRNVETATKESHFGLGRFE